MTVNKHGGTRFLRGELIHGFAARPVCGCVSGERYVKPSNCGWIVVIPNGKGRRVYVGHFKDKDDAVRARDLALASQTRGTEDPTAEGEE